ncbi:metallophosphoesterase [Salinisphaera sp. Q1T1-3]|uniref:metallophosphoesterase n=1 Tax=Salinisphaera sp. Q1T1-3 TaxID=2321229 RepID=UPI001314FBD5|nr:metallophosphoesterase [Salinisphaera sp. Q1T1-3]
MAAIEILHITDCHLLHTPGARLAGHDVAARFDAVCRQALADHPAADAVVLGGDLVDDESAAGYRWLDAYVAAWHRPVLAVAGNHDAPQTMADCLSHCVVHDTLALPGWRLMGLNSHVLGAAHGRLGTAALSALDATLGADATPTLAVVHHPPVAVGTPWIDAMGLTDAADLADVLGRHDHVRGILAGHVHQDSTTALGACPVWTTPSTMRQFRPGSPDFAEDPSRNPGYRHLRLGPNGEIETRVHRLDTARLAP